VTRQAIADAITAAGLSGSPWPPRTPTHGCGWPEWVRTTWTTGPCDPVGSWEWRVIVLLPPTVPQAWDGQMGRVAVELAKVGDLGSSEPATVTAADDAAELPAVAYTITTT
jgi:hypothetical protein